MVEHIGNVLIAESIVYWDRDEAVYRAGYISKCPLYLVPWKDSYELHSPLFLRFGRQVQVNNATGNSFSFVKDFLVSNVPDLRLLALLPDDLSQTFVIGVLFAAADQDVLHGPYFFRLVFNKLLFVFGTSVDCCLTLFWFGNRNTIVYRCWASHI